MNKHITIKKTDSLVLRLTFKDASGAAINLTGQTVKLIGVNMYNGDIVFEKSATTFTGSNNIATISFSVADTTALPFGEHRYYVRIETAQGQSFSSGKWQCFIGTQKDSHAEVRGIQTPDETILCDIDDIVSIVPPSSSSAPTSITLNPALPAFDEGEHVDLEVATITVDGSPLPGLTLSGPDTAGWSIVGNKLRFTGTMNYETKASYSLTINAENSQNIGNPYTEEFVIAVNDVDEVLPGQLLFNNEELTYNSELITY